ncbi:hypothetical protein [Halapricum desulfuricans]|uniref:Uncharacterized protein n=1 Tax=Halapricum desulfuricans TaxID=2841257 RepID=A0A897N6S8_9EURY|nr:hypothetical protein [Halapricum desulfuricans]QSG08161.1 hypothetical protein HSR122_0756 [Halapricum desulfuricans]
MASSLPADGRDLVFGTGAGVVGFLFGLALLVVGATGRIDLLDQSLAVVVLVVVAFAFGVAGLYDNVALGVPRRGAAHLVSGSAIVLALLAPYGESSRLFAVTAGLFLLAAGIYQLAIAVGVLESDQQPADELES